jgi:phosphatidate cytidylyltransferase
MHLKRWLTSLALIPVLVLLLFWGGAHLFPLFVVLACFLSLREYYRIVWPGDRQPPKKSIAISGYIMGPVLVLSAHLLPMGLFLFFFSISLILPGWLCTRHFKPDAGIPGMMGLHALAMVYIPLAMAAYILIYHADMGARWIFMILCVVSAGDIGAFYVGTHWGRRKLCPSVSPGKTVEGALGGLAANLLTGFIVGVLLMPSLPPGKSAVFFIALGVAGQIGDLFESMLKRSAGVKDSGNLLPGHGGVLDRIDALLFAGPVALGLIQYIY